MRNFTYTKNWKVYERHEIDTIFYNNEYQGYFDPITKSKWSKSFGDVIYDLSQANTIDGISRHTEIVKARLKGNGGSEFLHILIGGAK